MRTEAEMISLIKILLLRKKIFELHPHTRGEEHRMLLFARWVNSIRMY